MAPKKIKSFVFIPDAEHVGLRLDKALSSHPNIDSRSQAAHLIDRGLVTKNGSLLKPSYKVSLNEHFSVTIEPSENIELTPYDLKLDVVYEDDALLVVNKPSGLVVHPAAGHTKDTLVNALINHTNKLARGFDSGRPGLVHRIDKDTSGLIVIAKTETALRKLALQFKKKTTHRIYWCVTYGRFKSETGTVTSYLRRHPTDRKKFASEKLSGDQASKGKLAITHYKVLHEIPSGLSLVHCTLETGRTHQIRVHLSELQHPIVADPIYCTAHRANSVKSQTLKSQLKAVPHLVLHAAELGFLHPTTQKKMLFQVPWPKELIPFLKSVGLYEV
jgi:23S rRNA pseudouridine1911/1915/1917 synthase